MIPIHDPASGKLVARWDPDTKEVRDPWGHLLFHHDPVANTVEIAKGERKTVVPLDELKRTQGYGSTRL